jgi:hypothetical protein
MRGRDHLAGGVILEDADAHAVMLAKQREEFEARIVDVVVTAAGNQDGIDGFAHSVGRR